MELEVDGKTMLAYMSSAGFTKSTSQAGFGSFEQNTVKELTKLRRLQYKLRASSLVQCVSDKLVV